MFFHKSNDTTIKMNFFLVNPLQNADMSAKISFQRLFRKIFITSKPAVNGICSDVPLFSFHQI